MTQSNIILAAALYGAVVAIVILIACKLAGTREAFRSIEDPVDQGGEGNTVHNGDNTKGGERDHG